MIVKEIVEAMKHIETKEQFNNLLYNYTGVNLEDEIWNAINQATYDYLKNKKLNKTCGQ